MSNNNPVDPAEVPVFTGELAVLDEKVKALSGDGGALANAGSSVHTTFGGLSAYYKAPEAEQLFAVTKPVVDITMSFSGDMCTIAGALGSYANEIRPLVKKLETLKGEAASFQSKVSGDHKWNEDGDLVEENLDRRNDIAEVWSQFQAAERTAYDKIVALVCGTPLKVDDGSHGANMYGYDAEALKHSKSLPWGDAVEESVPWWQVWEHAYDFGKGVIVDGVWGTIKGLGTLVGFDGWDATKQAWTGLAKLATGVSIAIIPGVGSVYMTMPGKYLPSWLRDSRTAMKETGKAMLAWDQWSENPSRAAGAVTFNVVTAIFTDGAGAAASGAGKAGIAAKALSFAGKAGRAIDPMTYVFKGAGAGLSKIGDVMAGLKGIGKIEIPKISEGAFALPDGASMLPDGTIHLPSGTAVPEGAIKLPDDTIKLPEGTATLPPGTVKLPFDDSPAKYIDHEGNLYKEDGSLFQRAEDAKVEPGATTAHAPKVEAPVLVGVGAHNADNAIRLGSDISDPVHVGDHTPTGHAGDHTPGGHAPDGMPRNDLNTTPGTPHPGGDTPSIGGHPDSPSTAGHHPDSPSTGGAHPDGPSTGGPHLPDTPGTGGHHLPDAPGAAHAGDNAAAGGATAPHQPVKRPEFMLHGDNPYGPPGHLSEEQIREIQVYRANEEPGYFDEYYKNNGNRKKLEFRDESNFTPPQLTRVDEGSPWMQAKDAPEPPKPHYIDSALIHEGANTVSDASRLEKLKEATRNRYFTIEWDKLADSLKKDAEAHHKVHGTDESLGLWSESRGAYKESHTQMVKVTESYGEFVAEHHYIAEHHPGSVKQTLHGPKNGNDQFDQVWRRPDGKYVVVEAKSSVDTRLGGRNLPNGRRVSQGSREYFLDIIREMEDRGKTIKSERDLARALKVALKKGDLDYIVIKGDRNAYAYNGYHHRRFDISKGTLP
ncbi:hypothetical protein [Streptomyces sp. A1136]|uniref:hypothetical protein n=1 Tax=Streptomyces sp. A1136 TaxID=2563102 RepID=UPI00109EA2BE|nr:hypothetical protein [Streptomyces sp. A1136]THA55947.1 hypothetical protein E6R62_13410 [Streptomyces sp. A1136]